MNEEIHGWIYVFYVNINFETLFNKLKKNTLITLKTLNSRQVCDEAMCNLLYSVSFCFVVFSIINLEFIFWNIIKKSLKIFNVCLWKPDFRNCYLIFIFRSDQFLRICLRNNTLAYSMGLTDFENKTKFQLTNFCHNFLP